MLDVFAFRKIHRCKVNCEVMVCLCGGGCLGLTSPLEMLERRRVGGGGITAENASVQCRVVGAKNDFCEEIEVKEWQ